MGKHERPLLRLRLSDVAQDTRPRDEDYEDELESLQKELFALQVEYFLSGKSAIFAFEGWDAAGKGGVIKRLTERMDPRGYKVWPISAPRDEDARHHYLWRFWKRLPEKGEIGIFDRTWYGRVLVERVERLAQKPEWQRAYGEINAFEKMLTDDGVKVVKFWLQIDRQEQLRRFKEREQDPFKRYKIGPDDWRNRKKWKAYEKAVHDMFDRTDRPEARWHMIAGNDKRQERLEVLRVCVKLLRG